MNKERLKEFIAKVSEKYPNLDFTYLLPKESFFNKLFKKDITTEEYNKIYNEILDTILHQELERFPYSNIYSKQPYEKLPYEISRYNRLKACTDIKDNTFKYYPISIDKDTSKMLYNNEMKNIIKIHIETGMDIELIIEERLKEYESAIVNYKNELLNTPMIPYYGSPYYIIKRSKYIIELAKKLNGDTSQLEILVQKLDEFDKTYPYVGKKYDQEYPYFTEKYKAAYRDLEGIYLQVLAIEESLTQVNEQRWQSYLTNPLNHDDTNFKYLVHAFTGGFVPPNEMRKACTTLVTNSLLAIPYGTYGLIYDFTKEAVETISTEDAGSWVVDKRRFFEADLPLSWQFPNPEGDNIYYEYENNSKLVIPEDVEKDGINKNLKYNNNQPLTYDTCSYTEIYLNNKAKACGVFYTDDCKNVQEVIEYAEKYNLPVIHLSLQKLRLMSQREQLINNLAEQLDENNQMLEGEKLEEGKKL